MKAVFGLDITEFALLCLLILVFVLAVVKETTGYVPWPTSEIRTEQSYNHPTNEVNRHLSLLDSS